MAIGLPLELPVENRNDVQAVNYYIRLCESLLLNKEIDKVEKAIIITIGILSKQKANGMIHFEAALNLMVIITELKGDYQNDTEKLKEILRNMGT